MTISQHVNRALCLVAALVSLAAVAPASAQCGLAPAGKLGGSITWVANLSGDRAAIFSGGSIEVLNTAVTNFTRLGRTSLDKAPSAFSGGSNRVAVAWKVGGYDDPTAVINIYNTITNIPVLSSTITGLVRVQELLVTYPYLHVVGSDGYAIYDISDPAAPVRLGGLSAVLVPGAHELASAGTTVYIASSSRVLVVDFSVPAVPVIRGFRDLGTGNIISDLAATGSLVLAATDFGLYCLDVSNPVNPTVRSNYDFGYQYYSVVARGLTVAVRKGFAAFSQVDLLDYTNSAAPTAVATVLKTVSTITGPPTRVWSAEGVLQDVDGAFRGLTAYTITSPTVPTFYGSTTRGPSEPSELAVDADGLYAYTATEKVISPVYVGSPSVPVLMNDAGLQMPQIVEGLTILEDTLVPAWPGGMGTIDVAQPLTPTLRDTATFSGADGSVVAYGSTTFSRVVLGGNPIRVVDIATPTSIALYASIAHQGRVREVMSIPNRGFYAFTTSAGSISSISVNSSPLVLRQTITDPTRQVNALAGSGTRLYAVLTDASSAILRVISVLNPASMSVIGDVALPPELGDVEINDIAIRDDQLYISCTDFGLFSAPPQVLRFDIGIPDAPHLVETFDVPHAVVRSLAVTDAAVITAEGNFGLRTYTRPTSFSPYFTTEVTDNEVCWRGTIAPPAYAFTGVARAIPAPTYQWYRDNSILVGQTATTLALTTPQTLEASFRLAATNTCGTASSTGMLAICIADFNCSGTITVQDIFDFLAAYFAGSLNADINHSGGLSVQDIFDFLARYFSGCP